MRASDRSRRQSVTTMSHLPDELVLEILTWLPTKSIARFRCVSKTWKTLLRSPSFIRAHLHHFNSGKDPSIFIMYAAKARIRNLPPFARTKVYSIIPEPACSDNWNILKRNFPDFGLYPETSFGLSLVGSINGLVCLRSQYAIHIWNPSLHEYFTLPPFRIPSPEYYEHVSYGFGFNASTDDYTVVKFVYGSVSNDLYEIEVFNLFKGYWETINQVVPSHLNYINNVNGVSLNGSIHWLGCDYAFEPRVVLFDLALETFGEISLPDAASRGSIDLHLLTGHLALVSYLIYEFCEIWVMKEYGVHQSWVKEHVIPIDAFSHPINKPLGFSGTGELLFANVEHRVISYDPESKQAKDLGIIVYGDIPCCVTLYVESLLSFVKEPRTFNVFDL